MKDLNSLQIQSISGAGPEVMGSLFSGNLTPQERAVLGAIWSAGIAASGTTAEAWLALWVDTAYHYNHN
jgi:hypothetical protein